MFAPIGVGGVVVAYGPDRVTVMSYGQPLYFSPNIFSPEDRRNMQLGASVFIDTEGRREYPATLQAPFYTFEPAEIRIPPEIENAWHEAKRFQVDWKTEGF